jgi:hypothetical protein
MMKETGVSQRNVTTITYINRNKEGINCRQTQLVNNVIYFGTKFRIKTVIFGPTL